MEIILTEAWRDLTFMSALSEDRADRLVAFLAEVGQGVVVDLGCGWAELLLRVLAAAPAMTGIGVDSDADVIRRGRQLAADRGLSDRVRLEIADAAGAAPDCADLVIAVGATHVWAPPQSPGDSLHYGDALTRIRALLPRGGRAVFGEGIWSSTPTPSAIAALGGREDEMVSLGALAEIAARVGFAPMAVHEATMEEWDEFESGYSACYTRWLADHDAGHSDAAEVRARARSQRERYFDGYRAVLGLGYLELIAI